jgi:hypothetical protein
MRSGESWTPAAFCSASRGAEIDAVDDRIAAVHRLLFDDHNARTAFFALNGDASAANQLP